MATEKRLIDANAFCQSIVFAEFDTLADRIFINEMLRSSPTVDAVEVVYCNCCVNHGNCLLEDLFQIARIEKPYCGAGKKDGERNA